jgi:hypothetical protein
MINAEFAGKQVKRLAGMRGYSREPEALKELVKALQISASEDQAKAVISGFVEEATTETPCPGPGDIRRAVKAMTEENRPDPACHICGGDGWRTITKAGYSGSDRCVCWAPRPARGFEAVPLPGSPGYVAPVLPSREQIREDLERLKEKLSAGE